MQPAQESSERNEHRVTRCSPLVTGSRVGPLAGLVVVNPVLELDPREVLLNQVQVLPVPTAVQDIRNPGQVLEPFEDFPLAVQPIHCICPVQIKTGVGTRLLDDHGCIAVSAEIHAPGVRVSERTVDREGQRNLAHRRDFLEP